MQYKILIASLFATFILLVPISSVVSISEVSLNSKIKKIEDNNTITETHDNEDCSCEVISSHNLVKLESLLNRLEVYSKIILVFSKHNPMIIEKSQKLLEIFDTYRLLKNDIICLFLFFIMLNIGQFLPLIELIMEIFREGSMLFMIFLSIHLKIENIIYGILDLMEELECEIDIPWPP